MSTAVLREVRLYGELGRRFGRVFHLAVKTPREAAKALCAVLDGFERVFLGPDGQRAYHVFVGRCAQRRDVGETQVEDPLGATEPIRFVPVIAGAKRAGTFQVIAGAVLIVVGAVLTAYGYGAVGAPMIQAGEAFLIGGAVAMLTAQRSKSASSSDQTSYAFDGPVNNPEQGGPVPVLYGRVICGSVVVSQGLSTEQLVVAGATSGGNDGNVFGNGGFGSQISPVFSGSTGGGPWNQPTYPKDAN